MQLDSRISKNPQVSYANIGNDLVIMNLANNAYYRVNKIGADIWALLDASPTLQEICDQIKSQYNIDFERCLADVTTFISNMVNKGVLTVGENTQTV
jgi:hypothetical protein